MPTGTYMRKPRSAEKFAARFWSKVNKLPSGCWEWTRYREHHEYGRTYDLSGKRIYTHCLAWKLSGKEIPLGLKVLHKCDNPPCCNPAHLFLGTQADNIADKVAKNRHAKGYDLPGTKIGPDKAAQIKVMKRDGFSVATMARIFSVSKASIYRGLKQ